MVAAHEETRRDPFRTADGLLSLFGIEQPTRQQTGAAMVLAEFVLKVNSALGGK